MSKFGLFAQQVRADVERFKDREVYEVDIDKDELYAAYLAAFPAGTDPIFKTRTEHDCSCCKSFIRGVGNAVMIGERGDYLTVWDTAAEKAEEPYRTVALALRDRVRSSSISRLYRKVASESTFGSKVTRSLDTEGRAFAWNHFYSDKLPAKLIVSDMSAVARHQTSMQTAERAFTELSTEAVDTVLGLIDQNAIYRGREFRPMVQAFRLKQGRYLALIRGHKAFLADLAAADPATAGFRSTVIGTLVQDLSEGKSLEDAVRMYEAKVAPQNYKRTSALVTPRMIENAMATIQELGLEPALQRRLARLEDISVADVLWVSPTAGPRLKAGLRESLLAHAKPSKPRTQHGTKISMEDFLEDVLPGATDLQVLFENKHLGNMMVLTAPVEADAQKLFKWDNNFAWSYGGNVTDSIKERVKKAGGNVDNALFRVSLAWFNTDDLDLHLEGPEHVYYGSKYGHVTGAALDVDMNASFDDMKRDPVENISWAEPPARDWTARVYVRNFDLRERVDVGFTLQFADGDHVRVFNYAKAVPSQESVNCLLLSANKGKIAISQVHKDLQESSRSTERWGLRTGDFIPVQAVSLSPNYWGENRVGNKHMFFVLEGCACDEGMRGIYNEFLSSRLEQHRKVFELIGEKTKCAVEPGHIAGLGLSSTRKDEITVRVKGQVYHITA